MNCKLEANNVININRPFNTKLFIYFVLMNMVGVYKYWN